MRTANRIFSVFLASLFLVGLMPTPAGGQSQIGDGQKGALEAQFGPGAPYGVVGKMLEEVDLYLHSAPVTLGPGGWPERNLQSIPPAVPSQAGGNPLFQQMTNPTADFKRPEAYKKVDAIVVPTPVDFPQAIGDSIDDAANKQVRLGWADPEGAAVGPGGTRCTNPNPALPTWECVKGADTAEQVSFFTPAAMAAEADFRIYNVLADIYAECGVVDDGVFISNPNTLGTFVFTVYRIDSDGNRVVDGAGAPIIRSFRLGFAGTVSADPPVPTVLYRGAYLSSTIAPQGVSTPAIPNFFNNEGWLVKKGERLEFRISVTAVNLVPVSQATVNPQVAGNELTGPITPECFLHYDTRNEDSGRKYYEGGAYDAATPGLQKVRDEQGYESRIRIIGDTLRASTWFEDTSGRAATGIGNGDSFNLVTMYASAWGSIARPDNREFQSKALNGRVGQQFRFVPDFSTGTFFGAPGPAIESQPTDSVLVTKVPYTFGAGSTALGEYRSELFVNAAAGSQLVLRTQNFQGTQIAVSPSVFIGKTGMNFFLAAGENATHRVNPGEQTIFTYTVENLGSSADTITIIADAPGSGWTAQVLNGLQVVGGGGSASVNVLVTAPATAAAGAVSPPILVRALSSFADIIPPQQAQPVTVVVVSEVIREIKLVPATTVISVAPSGTRIFGVTVRNLGTSAENVLLTASIPAAQTGWSIKVNPTGKLALAGAAVDFQIEVKAPNTAAALTEFPLTLSATVVGGGNVASAASVLVKVTGNFGVQATIFPANRQINLRADGKTRQEGPINYRYNPRELAGGNTNVPDTTTYGCIGVPPQYNYPSTITGTTTNPVADPVQQNQRCIDTSQDPTYSGTVQFPILLTNGGTLDDTFKVLRSHTSFACGPTGTWDYRFGEFGSLDGVAYTASSNTAFNFAVKAGQSKLIIMELRPCADQTPTAIVGLVFQSSNDAAIKTASQSVTAVVQPTGAQLAKGQWANSAFSVGARFADGQSDTNRTLVASPSTYYIHAQNLGNQRDSLTIRLNQPAAGAGWTQKVSYVRGSGGFDAGFCQQVSDIELKCSGSIISPPNLPVGRYGMKSGESVLLAVNVTPGATIPVGSTFSTTLAVASGTDGSRSSLLEMVTTTTGTYAFQVGSPATTYSIERGSNALLPFSISNLGTNGDDYAISVAVGDASFRPRISLAETQFVPAGTTIRGFLSLSAPANATLAQPALFRINVESNNTPQARTLDLFATPVAPSNLKVESVPPGGYLLSNRSFGHPVQIKVTDLANRANFTANVSVDPALLPLGWIVAPVAQNINMVRDAANGTIGYANVTVLAPASELAASRISIRFAARTTTPVEQGFSDVVFDLASTSSLSIQTPLGTTGVTSPGAEYLYKLEVRNGGTANEPTTLSALGTPTGWSITFNPPAFTLGPLEVQQVDATVRAPATATPRTIAPIVVFATGNSGALSQTTLTTVVGYYDVKVSRADTNVSLVAPSDHATFVLNVTNNGTLTSDVVVTSAVSTSQYAPHVTAPAAQLLQAVRPGESRPVIVRYQVGPDVPSSIQIGLSSTVANVGLGGTNRTIEMAMRVYDYRAADPDGDGINEYAIDLDGLPNGYERFREGSVTSGRVSTSLVMTSYMNNASLARYTIAVPDASGNLTNVTQYNLDGDGDGRIDHFIDSTGNLLPDAYWDPDSNAATKINVTKDVNADDIPDFFVDRDGDGVLDGVYDLVTGNWTILRKMDIDGDGVPDYLVDLDGDGRIGRNETVLYVRGNKLLTVSKVDLNGDGVRDDVFDLDGDGRPDSFIPAGSTTSIPIAFRDVTGDGVLDWTFDLDGDGRRESYYDPTTGEVHTINTRGLFSDALRDNWYIGAMFGLVLILFVALIAVTRRG